MTISKKVELFIIILLRWLSLKLCINPETRVLHGSLKSYVFTVHTTLANCIVVQAKSEVLHGSLKSYAKKLHMLFTVLCLTNNFLSQSSGQMYCGTRETRRLLKEKLAVSSCLRGQFLENKASALDQTDFSKSRTGKNRGS